VTFREPPAALSARVAEVPECVYGNPSSKTTVVLFGDSHAMQWFPTFFWGGWGS
jgi:hypothetical protein